MIRYHATDTSSNVYDTHTKTRDGYPNSNSNFDDIEINGKGKFSFELFRTGKNHGIEDNDTLDILGNAWPRVQSIGNKRIGTFIFNFTRCDRSVAFRIRTDAF